MSQLCGLLARAAGVSESEAAEIEQASILHDVGKIGISDQILHKPGKLTPEERAEMERHPTIGAQLLAGSSSSLLQTSSCEAATSPAARTNPAATRATSAGPPSGACSAARLGQLVGLTTARRG